MPLIGKFKKTGGAAPAAAKPATKKPAGPPKSRWDGYSGGTDRMPMLDAPTQQVDYLLEVTACELKPSADPRKPNRETFLCTVKVLGSEGPDATRDGEERVIVCLLDNTGGQADFFRLARTVAGFETDDQFVEFCAEHGSTTGFFLEACCGNVTPFSPDGASPIVGEKFYASVTRGKDDGKGGYYRQYRFTPYAEES